MNAGLERLLRQLTQEMSFQQLLDLTYEFYSAGEDLELVKLLYRLTNEKMGDQERQRLEAYSARLVNHFMGDDTTLVSTEKTFDGILNITARTKAAPEIIDLTICYDRGKS